MDDGGPSLLDVISDPLLLQSFLEGEIQHLGKTQEDGKVSKSMISASQLSGQEHVRAPDVVQTQGLFPAIGLKPSLESMGYSFHGAVVTSMPNSLGMGTSMISGLPVSSATNTLLQLSADPTMQQNFSLADAASFRVSSSPAVTTFQYLQSQAGLVVPPTLSASGATIHHIPSPGGATIHHIPSSVQSQHHRPSSAPAPQIATPSPYNVKSPGQGPSSVHSLPPQSPNQQTRSPKQSHTSSPVPSWSPVPSALSSAAGRGSGLSGKPQVFYTTGAVNPVTPSSVSQKSHQLPQTTLQKQNPGKAQTTTNSFTTAQMQVPKQPVVQILAPQQNTVGMPRALHSSGRPIQPKPQQILPKPTVSSNQFSASLLKSSGGSGSPSVHPNQGPMSIGLNGPINGPPLVLGQSQPGVIAGPQGTIVLNQIIPGLPGQNPILIQGNLGSLGGVQGVQLALRPQHPGSLTVSTHSGHVVAANNSALVAALQNSGQPSQHLLDQGKSPLAGQQTLFIPNTITQQGLPTQGLTLGGTGIPSNSIVQSSAHPPTVLNARPNIILAPRVMGSNQCIQLQQIQTPQGPITVALAPGQTITLPQLQTAMGGTVSVPSVLAPGQSVLPSLPVQHPLSQSLVQPQQQPLHDIQTQQIVSGVTPALQPFLHKTEPQTYVQVSQSSPPPPQDVQNKQSMPAQMSLTPDTSSESSKPTKVPSVNLAELLKEHGILDSTPPSSPVESTSHEESVVKNDAFPVISSPPCTVVTHVSGPHSTFPSTINSQVYYSIPSHAQFSVAQDGSVIMQQPSQSSSAAVGTSVVMSSQYSNTFATDSGRVQSGHSALLERLNVAPAIHVPDLITSMALASCESPSVSSTVESNCVPSSASPCTLLPLTVQNINNNIVPVSSQFQQGFVTLPIISSDSDSRLSAVSAVPFTTSCVTTNTVLTAASILSDNNINRVLVGVQPIQLPGNTGNTLVASVKQPVPAGVPGSVAVTVATPSLSDASSDSSIIYNNPVQKTFLTPNQLQSLPDSNSKNAGGPSLQGQTIPLTLKSQHILQKVREQIKELLSNKSLTPHQHQMLQQLLTLQKKIILQAQLAQSQHQNSPQQLQLGTTSDTQAQTPVITSGCEEKNELPKTAPKLSTNQPSNLVNLLKKGPSSSSPTLRIIAPALPNVSSTVQAQPSNISSVNVPTQVRIGNQIITLAPQQCQAVQTFQQTTKGITPEQQAFLKQQNQQALVLKLQNQNLQTQMSQTDSSSSQLTTVVSMANQSVALQKIIQIQTLAKPPVSSVSKTALFQQELTRDHEAVAKPNTKKPFSSIEDSYKRLLCYHVYNSKIPGKEELQKVDSMFDRVSTHLLEKSRRMFNKYCYLLMKESMRVCSDPERVMLERLFIQEEKEALKHDREAVSEGKDLNLPPLPEHWISQSHFSSPSNEVSRTISQESDDRSIQPQIDELSTSRALVSNEEDHEQTSNELLNKYTHSINRSFQYHKVKAQNIHQSEHCEAPEINKSDMPVAPSSNTQLSTSQNNNRKRENPSDSHEDDMMTKIRKELNISLLDEEEEDHEPDLGHIDFEFEPPVIRREEAREKAIIKSFSGLERDLNLDYDFPVVNGTWPVSYSDSRNKHVTQRDSGMESILTSHDNEPELDLSGIEGLDGFEDHHNDLHNGLSSEIDDVSLDGELTYEKLRHHDQRTSSGHIGFNEIPSHTSRDETDELNAQVQSAIKSILDLQSSESRSYCSDGDGEFISHVYRLEGLDAQRDQTLTNYEVNLSCDVELANESDAAIDEAVQSILF
ncbi:mucin-6-like isoform X2 [Limulus polyphemus]|uniref:Mucin-6-like isoform X2 n=1 Tax=Limulus polyphemus TaxID=6850 RepID=A0ABM1S5M1_LIMPO|nr:mucin-6-like isoform X2 [Limulus polyphemus]